MFPSAPSQCYNCSAAEGIPAHLFWFCPQFFDFCSAIFTRFLNVTTKTSNQITTLQWLLKLFCYQTQLWKNNTDTLTFIELQPCNVWILETATHTRPAHSLTSQDGGRQKGSSTGLEIHPPPKFELCVTCYPSHSWNFILWIKWWTNCKDETTWGPFLAPWHITSPPREQGRDVFAKLLLLICYICIVIIVRCRYCCFVRQSCVFVENSNKKKKLYIDSELLQTDSMCFWIPFILG